MGSWRNRPKHISELKADIPYVVAIDESGSPSLKYLQKKLSSNTEDNCELNDIHFNVTACLMETSHFIESQDMVMGIKNKFWSEGFANYKGDKKRVCFHSTEIRRRTNAFNFDSLDKHKTFINELGQVMSDMNVKLFYSHINKLELIKQYSTPYNPYELSLTFIFERLSYEIGKKKAVIVLESRGKKEDKVLLKHIVKMIDQGTRFLDKSKFSFIEGVYFNGKWEENSNNLKSYWILEMADLYCYPLFKFGKLNEKDQTFQCCEEKIICYPDYIGKGFKKFPYNKKTP